MSGSLRFAEPDEPAALHDHVDWLFDDGTTLRLRDPRRFGAVLWTDDVARHPLLAHLGPEPLTPAFDAAYLHAQCQRRSAAIKQVIMDAQVVVGVGNIYASESLFHAGIRPATAARRLSRPACARLAAAIRQVLTAAIAAGGSSLRDYVAQRRRTGLFPAADAGVRSRRPALQDLRHADSPHRAGTARELLLPDLPALSHGCAASSLSLTCR